MVSRDKLEEFFNRLGGDLAEEYNLVFDYLTGEWVEDDEEE